MSRSGGGAVQEVDVVIRLVHGQAVVDLLAVNPNMQGALFNGDGAVVAGDGVVIRDVKPQTAVVDRDHRVVDVAARIGEGEDVPVLDAEGVAGRGQRVRRIGGQLHGGYGMGVAIVGEGGTADAHGDGAFRDAEGTVRVVDLVVMGHVPLAVGDAEDDAVGGGTHVEDNAVGRGDLGGMACHQISLGDGKGGLAIMLLRVVHPLSRGGGDGNGTGLDGQRALDVGDGVVHGDVLVRPCVVDAGEVALHGVDGRAYVGDGYARQGDAHAMTLQQGACGVRPAGALQGLTVVDLGGAFGGDRDGSGLDGEGGIGDRDLVVARYVLPRLIGDAGGVLYVGMGCRSEGDLAPGLQGQGMALGEGIGERNHRKGSRLEGGAVVDLLAVVQPHRQGAGGDLQGAEGIARDVVIGGDILAVTPEFHPQMVGDAAHVAEGGGIHGAVLVSHAVLHGDYGQGLVGAVIDQHAAFGMDGHGTGGDREGTLLDKDGVVMAFVHAAVVADGEGQDVGGGAHVQNGGGGLDLQAVAAHQGGGAVQKVLGMVDGVTGVHEGGVGGLNDEGALLHRELARLDRDVVEVCDVGAACVIDPQVGGVGLGARIHEGIAEDGDQIIPREEGAARDLVAVEGQGGIVVGLGGVADGDGQGTGSEADRHPLGGGDGVAAQAVVPLLIGDAEGGQVGVGGGMGRAVVRQDHAAGGAIPLGQALGLDAGHLSVGGGGIGDGQMQLPREDGDLVGVGVGLISEGGFPPCADGVAAGVDGLPLRPTVASRGTVLVVGL